MLQLREAIILRTAALLKGHGFSVESFLHTNSCFDFAAKRGSEIFLIKVFENIDSLREEQALELKQLSLAFNATAIVVGKKTKAFALKENVAYGRYGIPVLSIESFSALLDKRLPAIRFFKGKETVRIDAQKLKEKRKQLGLSLSELAQKIGSNAQAIFRYEESAQSSPANARKLEDALQEKLVLGTNIFEKKPLEQKLFEEKSLCKPDDSFERMRELGLKLALFEHAPFRAYSKPEESLLIDKGYNKSDLKKKAMLLEKAKGIVKGHSVIISKETKYSKIQSTPIIQEEELESFSKASDLLETIKEREKKKQN